ncbi:FadR/GntR family transcriptional regulator [Megamonas hypermegale]|uniref:Pyruvate dehydrogenase complex repressor n=2 Tax=Megamonas hypermegale TaxID=158847 RepID=A0A239U465_9FIRM|nr:FadR/GntR family transcriptional regulator [Megamonas hypermegale]SNV04439.1 Pyruvate dehydrogenase complex repressor [Megamonas hypermegale]
MLVGEIMGLAKIGNSDTLVNEIITQLSQAIIEGDFKPGDKLPSEAELCEQLAVGRNSLREAIRVLNAMGVVKTKRGQGTFLQDTISHEVFNPLIFRLILDPKNTTDVFELRVMVESIVIIMAIYKASPEEIQSIRDLVDETNNIAKSNQGSIDDLIKLDMQFHLSIAKCVHNKLIESILETLVLMFEPSIKKVLQKDGGIDLCLKNHYAIVNLIEQRDVINVFNTVRDTLVDSFAKE